MIWLPYILFLLLFVVVILNLPISYDESEEDDVDNPFSPPWWWFL